MGTELAGRPRALLDDIDRWAIATKSSAGELGQMVLNHGGFAPLLRKRGTLSPETETRVRAFMACFPDREALPPSLIARLKNEARANRGWAQDRHRSLMMRLGYSSHPSIASAPGSGEGVSREPVTPPPGKPRINAAVIRAAKLDGRDLPTFVTALIDMGLECWRDDRVQHGEAVA